MPEGLVARKGRHGGCGSEEGAPAGGMKGKAAKVKGLPPSFSSRDTKFTRLSSSSRLSARDYSLLRESTEMF